MNLTRRALVVVTLIGLAVDVYVHFSLARDYDGVQGTVSQGQLFRVEAVAAIVAALLLLFRPGRVTAAVAAVVAGGGTAALLLVTYVDIGALGPFPNMYEPLWYAQKSWTAIAQAAATGAAVLLVILGPQPRTTEQGEVRRAGPAGSHAG